MLGRGNFMRWVIQNASLPQSEQELEELLLETHGVSDSQTFFAPRDPREIPLSELGISKESLTKILERFQHAKDNDEEILVFGDYDADGITATALLWETLHALGFRAWPFIPQRLRHGYGLSLRALQDVFLEHPKVELLVTVDNGIVAHEALQSLEKQKIDVIVTDHHQPDGKEPEAKAVFHSTQVCGAALAWFLSRELLAHFAAPQKDALLTKTLELLAISTVTDLMPLQGINRDILVSALKALRQSKRPGLQALFQFAKVEQKELSSYQMGFVIGPRINAMGRLGDATDALRLLCTNDPKKAQTLAKQLQDTNSERQNLTQDLIQTAEAKALAQVDQKILLVAGEDYHEGVIGLLAGKLLEKYHKPTIVFSCSENLVKASARSLPGFHITEFIRRFAPYLLEFGGHPLAAGFALEPKNLEVLQKAMWQAAAEELAELSLEPELSIDCQLPASLVSLDTVAVLEKFEPFGLANPQPKFLLKAYQLESLFPLGNSGEHWRLSFRSSEGISLELLAFSQPTLLKTLQLQENYDLVVALQKNVWHQRIRLQVILKDWRISQK
jgi:single-stranded-DNA-specific exonuclease